MQELAVEHAWTKEHQQQLASGLRSTLQALTNQAVSAEQRLMSYTPDGHQQPAVSMLLKAAIGLAQKVRIGKGMLDVLACILLDLLSCLGYINQVHQQMCVPSDHAFQLFEDIVETGDIEEVKTAFKLVYKHWDVSEHWENPLAMQRACNMFVKRLSNDQDAEFLGTVLTLVAKILPFNAKAGLNLVWLVNQHPIHIDEHVQVRHLKHALTWSCLANS